jgi:hypothetical protein
MFRNVIAIIAGLAVGMTANMALITLNSKVFYPMPEGLRMDDAEGVSAWMATLPATAFLVVMLAHLSQALCGGWVAARLASSHPMRLAMSVGVFSLVGGVMAFFMFDGPIWMVVELPLYLAVAWLVGRTEERRRVA